MACKSQLLTNIGAECGSSKGGVKAIWIGGYDEKKNFTTVKDSTLGINMAVSAVPDVDWYRFEFRKQSANFTSEMQYDATNGVKYYTNTITMSFTKMEAQKRLAIAALALGEAYVVVQDFNGEYHCFGLDESVVMSGGNGSTGSVKTDANAYSITLTTDSDELPLQLNEAGVADFEEKVSE